MQQKFTITKEQQIAELTKYPTPIINVDIVVMRPSDGRYLVGQRSKEKFETDHSKEAYKPHWLFPGSRMQYTESPQETAERVLVNEFPGVQAQFKKLIAVTNDKGFDARCYGVTIYYLFEYSAGEPESNYQLDQFQWVNREEFLNLERAFWLHQSIVNEIDLAVRTRNTSQDEIIVEVDKDDKEIGTIIKRIAHIDPSRYHRAAHILIYNSQGQVILQKRGVMLAHHPRKWDMIGGHQSAGHTIEQTAAMELAEELGSTAPLVFRRVNLFQNDKQSEYCYVYYAIDDGPYGFDRNEVEMVQTFDCQKLLDRKYDNEYEILGHVYTYVEEMRDVWEPLIKKK